MNRLASFNSLSRLCGMVVLLTLGMQLAHAERKTTYYHMDALGSVVAASNAAGALMWRKEYAPYGAQLDSTAESEKLAYTGKEHDDATGLTYFGARYYDPELARFMSIDPVGFAEANLMSFNRYAYVNNNPYKYVDPDGRDLVLVGDAGQSGKMFELAAKTWVKQNAGKHTVVNVRTGTDMIKAMQAYSEKNGGIDGMRVFSHSGNDGIYTNASSRLYRSLYSSGPGYVWSVIAPGARRIDAIKSDWFKDDATVQLFGCNTANGEDSFAELLANQIDRPVTGSQSPTIFTGVKNGKGGQGLPGGGSRVPENYKKPVYLVPEGKGWKTYGK